MCILFRLTNEVENKYILFRSNIMSDSCQTSNSRKIDWISRYFFLSDYAW